MKTIFIRITATTLLIGIAVIFALMISSCSQTWYQRRDIKRQHLYNSQYPSELAKDCFHWFPPKDSIGQPVIDSTNLAHNDDYEADVNMLYRQVDSLNDQVMLGTADKQQLQRQISSLKARMDTLNKNYKPCKPSIVYQKIPVYRENTAQLKVFQDLAAAKNDSLKKAQGQITQLNTDKSSMRKWIWILGGILAGELVITIIWIVIKIYTGGWVKSAESSAESLFKK